MNTVTPDADALLRLLHTGDRPTSAAYRASRIVRAVLVYPGHHRADRAALADPGRWPGCVHDGYGAYLLRGRLYLLLRTLIRARLVVDATEAERRRWLEHAAVLLQECAQLCDHMPRLRPAVPAMLRALTPRTAARTALEVERRAAGLRPPAARGPVHIRHRVPRRPNRVSTQENPDAIREGHPAGA